MCKVTVVIPNYNGIRYLRGCLESLYRLRDEADFVVIVVDNGSSDGSCEWIRQNFPQAELIALGENTGFCHAVNMGIRQAETPYVILLNNDTEVKSGFIKYLLEKIQAHENIFSVSARMLMWDRPDLVDDAGDRYCVLGWAYARGKGKPAVLYDRPAEIFAACGGAAIYRRSVFEEIGYFDEAHFAYLEDIDIGYRARIYGYRSFYEPRAKVLHAGSASTGSRYNAFKTEMASANSVYLIGKNMPLPQVIWNLPFLLAGFLIKTMFFFSKKMGMIYIKGLLTGLRRSLSEAGRGSRVRFCRKRLKNYLRIQLQLYADTLRLFHKI